MKMKITMQGTMATIAVVVLCTMSAPGANAECGFSTTPKSMGVWPELPSPQAHYQLKAAPEELPQASEVDPPGASIVGLWKITISSGGQVVLQGIGAWHSDGTETLNDTSPPATGNVCLGVWEKTGPATYKLKHPGFHWDADGNVIATFIIGEQITVDNGGQSYTGTATFDLFDLNGNKMFHQDGEVKAQRITVN